jgi:hypothetical protein
VEKNLGKIVRSKVWTEGGGDGVGAKLLKIGFELDLKKCWAEEKYIFLSEKWWKRCSAPIHKLWEFYEEIWSPFSFC